MSNGSTLSSLAMLKVNYDEKQGNNYLDYVLPLVVNAVFRSNQKSVTSEDVQSFMQDRFGLHVPIHVIGLLLRRLTKRGHFSRDHGVFHVVNLPDTTDMNSETASAQRATQAVLHALIDYAKDNFSIEWNTEDATDAVIEYLHQFSIDFLKSYHRGTALPPVTSVDAKHIYVVASFIAHTSETQLDLFDAVLVLVKGHMLANALLCPDLDALQRKFGDVSFYFDTPILLNLLDPDKSPQHRATTELVELLANLGGKLRVFAHTMRETRNVYVWLEKNMDNPDASGKQLERFRRQSLRPSDVVLMASGLEHELKAFGVRVMPTPTHVAESQIAELDLEDAIEDEISYSNPKARLFDIESIRSVYTLRDGGCPERIEDCKAILVTDNGGLACAAQKFADEQEEGMSSVILDYALANMAWLKAPLGASDLPRLQTMAFAYGALDVPSNLWGKYVDEIDRLRDRGELRPEDHEVLRSRSLSGEALMEETLGDEDRLSRDSIYQVLERAKKRVTAEKEAEFDTERQEHVRTLEALEREREQRDARQKRLFWLSRRVAKVTAKSVFAIALVALLAGLLWGAFAFDVSLLGLPPVILAVILGVLACAVLVAVVLGTLNIAWGLTLASMCEQLSKWIERWVYSRLEALLGTTKPTDAAENQTE